MNTVSTSTKLLLAAIAGAGVVGVLTFVDHSSPDPVAGKSSSSGSSSGHPPSAPAGLSAPGAPAAGAANVTAPEGTATAPPACDLVEGQRFGATFRSKAFYEMGQTPGGPATRQQTVNGTLAFEVLESSPESAVVLVGFSPDGKSDAVQEAGAQALAAPFLARVNARCEVARFARHNATSERVATLQQSLLHELWFSVPERGDKAPIRFKNAVGDALGEMRVEAGGTLLRTVNLYEKAWSPDMRGVRVRSAELRVDRGGTPWFKSLRGEQSLRLPSSLPSGRSTLRVDAVGIDANALVDASRDVDAYVWENLLKPLSRQVTPGFSDGHARRVEEMKSVTFQNALTHFGTLVETKAQPEDQHMIMAAFLDAHPEHISAFAQMLASQLPDEWKPPGYAALQATQHPAAKTALLEVFRETRFAPMERVRSSLALAGRLDTGAPLARELSATANGGGGDVSASDGVSVPKHALLHLGVLAGTHPDDEEVAEIARDTLSAKLRSAETRSELRSACLAVANTGDIAFLADLDAWSRHENPDLREVVAIGIRRMPTADTHDFVLDWLERETSYRVKREIFEVMQRQYHDEGAVMDDALIGQTIAHLDQRPRPRALTRQSMYRLLTPVVRTHGEVRRALRDALVFETQKKSGMANYLMSILPQGDVSAALASIPSLSDQFGSAPTGPTADVPSAPKDEAPPPDLEAAFGDLVLPAEPQGAGVQ